ncbi:unnamed protein product [Leptosia nina]|uniref:Uncharacterized protein n=1 Tax=Leptosia nina TaxID=320188 RepID=A0AAV1J718_9NEOP
MVNSREHWTGASETVQSPASCVNERRAIERSRGRRVRSAVRGAERGQRRRFEPRRVLRERVPAQVERRLEAAAALRAHHRLRLVDEPHVLAQVRRVGVAAAALRALHARSARAARCQQHHVRTAPSGPLASPRRRTTAPRNAWWVLGGRADGGRRDPDTRAPAYKAVSVLNNLVGLGPDHERPRALLRRLIFAGGAAAEATSACEMA